MKYNIYLLILLSIVFYLLEAKYFNILEDNIFYKYNVVEKSEKSEFSKTREHTVLRFNHKVDNNVKTNINFVQIRGQILAVLHVNCMLCKNLKEIELSTKDKVFKVINFNNYFPTDSKKLLYLFKHNRLYYDNTHVVLDIQANTIYNSYRTNSYQWFLIEKENRKNILNDLISYSFIVNDIKYTYKFNNEEKILIKSFKKLIN